MSNNGTPARQFSYGGQAVIEGVMMRGAHKAAVAARDPNGEIHIKEIDLNATLYRGWVARTPFVRGLVGLWDALGIGTQALLWSADVALIEGSYYRVNYNGQVGWIQYDPTLMRTEGNLKALPKLESESSESIPTDSTVKLLPSIGKPIKIKASPTEKGAVLGQISMGDLPVTGFMSPPKEDFFTGWTATLMVVFSLSLGIGLFFLLPTAVSSGVGKMINLNGTGTNIVEEAVKMTLFLGYILMIGQMRDVKRLFQYHGAEHKTINAYEAGAVLTPQTVQTFPIEHPRCGTAFLLNVIIISIVLNTLIGRFDNNLLLLIPARLVTIPVVAGIAYEWLRWTAQHVNNPIVGLLIKPNLWLQKLTTNEPEDDMVAVAIASLERVLASEGIKVDSKLNETIVLTRTGQPALSEA